jgi:tetratricopeptide (TPR) repeat protein
VTSTSPDDVVSAARRLIDAGDLPVADSLLHDALPRARDPAELLYLRGVIANRMQHSGAAVGYLRAALVSRPDMTAGWLALGHAHVRLAEFPAAAQAYERAVACEPLSADTHFNLGVVRRRLNDLDGAARAFHEAWRLDPMLADAAKACVGTLALRVRSSPDAAPVVPQSIDGDARSVSVIVCSVDDRKACHAAALYARLFAGVRHELITIRDAQSLAEAYNRGIDHATGDVIVLSHDDIDVLALDFAARLLMHLRTYDVVGVVGGTRMTGPLPIWAGHPHVRGWITHHAPESAEWQVDILHPSPVAGDVEVLDGVLLAARREVFTAVRFDSATFDGFHGYDIDWSYRAALAGYSLAAAGDFRLVHASRGRFDDAWQRYAERFCAKHRTGNVDPAPVPYYEVSFGSQAQVEAFYSRLLRLAQDAAG